MGGYAPEHFIFLHTLFHTTALVYRIRGCKLRGPLRHVDVHGRVDLFVCVCVVCAR